MNIGEAEAAEYVFFVGCLGLFIGGVIALLWRFVRAISQDDDHPSSTVIPIKPKRRAF